MICALYLHRPDMPDVMKLSDRKDAEVIIYELVFTKEKYAETMRSVIESYLERQACRHNEQIQP